MVRRLVAVTVLFLSLGVVSLSAYLGGYSQGYFDRGRAPHNQEYDLGWHDGYRQATTNLGGDLRQ